MTYAQDFPETWSRCDLIIGASSGVPIKRGAVEAIGAAIPIGKGKEKKVKQKRLSKLSLKRVLKVPRLALRPRREKLRNLRSN